MQFRLLILLNKANKMKLSQNTLSILNNFSSINQSIKFSGNKIKTIAGDVSQESVQAVASAKIEEDIPNEVAIYDLQSFLQLIKLYGDIDYSIEFGKNSVTLATSDRSTTFKYCNPDIISDVPDLSLDESDVLVSFELTDKILSEIRKVSSVLNFEGFYFKSVKGKLEIHLYDVKTINNTPEHVIHTGVKTDNEFNIYFEMKNLYVIPGTYLVKLTEDKIHFKSQNLDLEYYIVTSNEPL